MDHKDFDNFADLTPSEVRVDEQVKDLFVELEAELYPGCKMFSSLSFLISLMHIKVTSHWMNKSFTELLQLLRKSPSFAPFSSSRTLRVEDLEKSARFHH
jgi:hypothetical protein